MQPGGAPLAPLAPLTPRAAPPAGEKYAFVTLPYAEFVEGTINQDNIGFGALCPLPAGGLPADALVHGLVIFSKRSAAISAWLTGIDLVFVKASLETREVLLEVGLDTQHAQHRRHAPPPQPQPQPQPQPAAADRPRPPPPRPPRSRDPPPPTVRHGGLPRWTAGPLAVASAGG